MKYEIPTIILELKKKEIKYELKRKNNEQFILVNYKEYITYR